jgi:hypothetical protein
LERKPSETDPPKLDDGVYTHSLCARHAQGLGRVEDEAVLDVRGQGALPRGVDSLRGGGDELDVARDVVLGAEVDHLLGLADAADEGALEREAAAEEGARRELPRVRAAAHGDEGAAVFEEVEVPEREAR